MISKSWLVYVACALGVAKCDFNPVGSVDCGEAVFGSIDSYEINNYTFELTKEYAFVQISTCGSSYDTWLYVWNSDGDEIDDCDDCGDCGVRTVLTIDDLSAGSYYIGVGGFSSSSGVYVADVSCTNATIEPVTTQEGSGSYYSDWECNHVYGTPLPMPCTSYGDSRSGKAECISDDAAELSYYNESSDCSGEVLYTRVYNTTDFGDALACSYGSSCDYFSYAVYEDGKCEDDNLRGAGYSVVGECISYDIYDVSYKDKCSNNGDITTTIYSCPDCASSCSEYTDSINFYDQFNDSYCVTVKYSTLFVFLVFFLFARTRVHMSFLDKKKKKKNINKTQ